MTNTATLGRALLRVAAEGYPTRVLEGRDINAAGGSRVRVRAVLFDFDFTLGDSADAIVHCARAAFADMGSSPPTRGPSAAPSA